MDHIKSYYKISNIKPDKFKIPILFNSNSNKRFIFNLNEQELHYNRNHNVYLNNITTGYVGGHDGSKPVLVLDVDF